MELQSQDEEDQLTAMSRAPSRDGGCLAPNEQDQSALSYTEATHHESQAENQSQTSVSALANAFMEGVNVSETIR